MRNERRKFERIPVDGSPLTGYATPAVLWKSVEAIVCASVWTWIALIYAVQVVGALVATKLFRMHFGEVALPVFLLCVGTVLAGIFRRYDHSGRVGRWKWWLPALIYALFIYFLSDRSYPDAVVHFETSLFHPLEYMTLGIFFCWVWHPVLQAKGWLPFSLAVVLSGVLFGMSDEIHQAFIPGRSMDPYDVLLDLLGLSLGCGVFMAAGRVHKELSRYLDTVYREAGGGERHRSGC